MVLGNLDFPIGNINPSGIGVDLFRIAKSDIVAFPTISDDLSSTDSIGSLSTYEGDFSLASGKKFDRVYCTQGKGKVSFETIGERDAKMYNNKLSISFPDLSAEALAFSKAAANGDFVFVVKASKRFHIIGSPDYRTEINSTGDSGDTAGSAKGVTYEIVCPDVTPLPIYTGELPLSNGTIDCSTGVLTAGN